MQSYKKIFMIILITVLISGILAFSAVGLINDKIEDEIGGSSLININTANLEKLQELTGIGESKAKAIIEYREKNGNFNSIEDLLNVEGIGNTLYEQIKIYITT